MCPLRHSTLAATLALVASCGGSTQPDDVVERVYSDHREIDLEFMNGSDRLSGTLYLPLGDGPFPTVAVNEGSSWTTRATWEQVAPFVLLLGGTFTWDKRGNGRSGGECCPSDDQAAFALAAADAVGAVDAVRQ